MSDEIPPEEKNIAIKRINSILNEFEDALKIAENLYGDAVKKGAENIQKEIQKKIKKIKKEESVLHNIILVLEGKA